MYRFAQSFLSLAVLAVGTGAVWGQIDDDLPTTVTAACFSRCEGVTNVKGVEGQVTVKNTIGSTVNLSATVKVQCTGVDVPNASVSLGPTSTAAGGTTVFPYSISFVPVGGCSYTVVAEGISSFFQVRNTKTAGFGAADCIDQPCGSGGCTLTQGYWKNHAEKWPVTSLSLGSVSYSQAQLLRILRQPVRGNGLVSLSHQLIAAKLNLANSAGCQSVNASIAAADALIGAKVVPPIGAGSLSTSVTSTLVGALDSFNNGRTPGCPGHCSE